MINIHLDVRSDIKQGTDPDKYSKTLREFHRELWSKQLPNGRHFELSINQANVYLHHKSEIGEYKLASDGIAHSFFYVKRVAHILNKVGQDELKKILDLYYTIPGFIIFPANQINKKVTINAARGFNARICDRFDLTLECVRRFYLGIENPLLEVLNRYSEFFNLFQSFEGYLEFFLLQDMWDNKASKIKFFMPFDDSFPTQPIPSNKEEYLGFIQKQSEFVQLRGQRMI